MLKLSTLCIWHFLNESFYSKTVWSKLNFKDKKKKILLVILHNVFIFQQLRRNSLSAINQTVISAAAYYRDYALQLSTWKMYTSTRIKLWLFKDWIVQR